MKIWKMKNVQWNMKNWKIKNVDWKIKNGIKKMRKNGEWNILNSYGIVL